MAYTIDFELIHTLDKLVDVNPQSLAKPNKGERPKAFIKPSELLELTSHIDDAWLKSHFKPELANQFDAEVIGVRKLVLRTFIDGNLRKLAIQAARVVALSRDEDGLSLHIDQVNHLFSVIDGTLRGRNWRRSLNIITKVADFVATQAVETEIAPEVSTDEDVTADVPVTPKGEEEDVSAPATKPPAKRRARAPRPVTAPSEGDDEVMDPSSNLLGDGVEDPAQALAGASTY